MRLGVRRIGLDPVTANATNRLPVLIGAMSATGSFHRQRAIPWRNALVVALPVTAGAGVGAVLAEVIPSRDLALVITAAVLVALLLLFTKLKSAIANAEVRDTRLGAREIALFAGIGVWLGFIVLDKATYLLLALTLAVGLPLVQANAVKTLALVPTSLLALVIFAAKGHVDWGVGAVMAVPHLGLPAAGPGHPRRAGAPDDPLRVRDRLNQHAVLASFDDCVRLRDVVPRPLGRLIRRDLLRRPRGA